MFKIHELRELIKLIDQSSIQEFDLEHEGSKITMKKQGEVVTMVTPAPVVQAPVEQPVATAEIKSQATVEAKQEVPVVEAKSTGVNDENLYQVKSPMVGTFYKAPSPDAPPYVKVGDKIEEASIVCIVEAMKLFNEIEAEIKGEIVEILVENAQLVEYGQPLFLVRPE